MLALEQSVIKWMPHPGPQEQFHLTTDNGVYECLFGGTKGPGKTDSILREGLRQIHIPDYRAIIFRRVYPRLGEIIDRSFKYFKFMGATYSGKDMQIGLPAWTFPSGAKYAFGHCQNEQDKYNYQGKEFHYMGFDQIEEFTESQFLFLMAQNRTSNPAIKCYIRATANPGGIGHCVPFGEVLTETGWKEIQTVNQGELVATLDESEKIVYRPVEQLHQSHYSGNMLSFKSSTAFITATPNHRIARRTETKNSSGRTKHGISLVQMSKLSKATAFIRSGEWEGRELYQFHVKPFKTRKLKLSQPSVLSGDLYCSLMGWYLSEGYTVGRDKAFGIAQSKVDNRNKIRELLSECGFEFGESKTGFLVHSPSWWSYLRQYGKCRDKFVPDEIKSADKRQIKLFLETAILGDGHGRHYYTTSKRLADDMQELGLKAGFSPRITSRQRSNRAGLSYDVSFRDGRDGWLKRDKVREQHFEGNVYCLGIKGLHRFFLRQEGTVWLSGNSWVKKRYIDVLKPGEAKYFKRVDDEDIEVPKEDNNGISRSFVPASVYDNPSIIQNDPNYVRRLEQLPETDKQALLYGNWEVFKGQFFKMWRKHYHVKEVPILSDTHKFISLDYGYGAPSCALWFQVDFGGNLHVYRELYKEGLTYEALAQRISELTPESERIDYCVADPAIWGDKTHHSAVSGESGAETMQKVLRGRMALIKGDNSRVTGWGRVRIMLNPSPNEDVKLTFSARCKDTIRTIPTLIHDDADVEDLNSDGEDHAADSLRYGVMSRPISSVMDEVKVETRSLDWFKRVEKSQSPKGSDREAWEGRRVI